MSFPDFTPQKSVANASFRVVRFSTNSPVSRIIWFEKRSGRIETDAITGSLEIVPVHAAVMIFAFPSASAQLTITTGLG